MSAITTQKELLKNLLVAAGLAPDRIALQEANKKQLQQANLFPWAAIISGSARFELPQRREAQVLRSGARLYKQLRCKVSQPFVVQVFEQDEARCTELMESFVENIPYSWVYKDLQGLIELKNCEHSDFHSVVSGCYESALLLEFEMDLGPKAQVGKKIQAIDAS
ncbi:MAG: hypothetical protein AAF975_00065 [Spirochaetota bacterium]